MDHYSPSFSHHCGSSSSCMQSHFSCVRLFVTLWMVAHHAPLSMGFCRQQYWHGLPCPPAGDLPDPRIKPTSLTSPALASGLSLEPPGKPMDHYSPSFSHQCGWSSSYNDPLFYNSHSISASLTHQSIWESGIIAIPRQKRRADNWVEEVSLRSGYALSYGMQLFQSYFTGSTAWK